MIWIAGIAFVVVLVGYLWYAMIITRRNRVGEALGGIDVQLNQRHDLVPNLLTIARRFMQHEQELLTAVTELRTQAQAKRPEGSAKNIAEKFAAEEKLEGALGRLMVAVEAYPDLQSDGPMIEAQRGLQEVETNIAAARRFYNASVGELRNSTQIFPGPFLARLAGVTEEPPFFETTAETRVPIDASKYLG